MSDRVFSGTLPYVFLWTGLVLTTCSSGALAQFDPPSGYYETATGVGETLKSQLHDLIDGHTVFSYGEARTALQVTDADPEDPSSILLVYDRVSLDVSAIGGSIPGWDSGQSWNREHTWPRSLGVGSSGADNSDLHQLRPSTPSVNSSRSNLPFGGEFGQPFGRVNDGGARWYPGDADAGLIARQQFYTAVRYDGSDSSTTDLELTSGATGDSSGDLDRLIEWHFRAAPDDFELRRNQIVFDDYQGNRNPFVDHPEFVWSVFVDQENDSRVVLPSGEVQPDGGFRQTVDLGRHFVNTPTAIQETVRIDKLGADGTYLRVTGEGFAANSPVNGRYALATGEADSLDLTVGASVDTGVVGDFSGSLLIDNLDITDQGGPGVGSRDVNDVVDLHYQVLNHPVASFSPAELVTEITLDLGFLPLIDGVTSLGSERLVNFAGSGAPVSASALDLDVVSGIGDSDTLSLGLSAFQGLLQGEEIAFDVNLNADAPGGYSSRFELLLSGEDLPGEQSQSLFINLTAEIVAGELPGDFNDDGVVDAADYTVWRDAFDQPAGLINGVATGLVDLRDYEIWLANFGTTASNQSIGVPEPAAVAMLAAMAALVQCRRSVGA